MRKSQLVVSQMQGRVQLPPQEAREEGRGPFAQDFVGHGEEIGLSLR